MNNCIRRTLAKGGRLKAEDGKEEKFNRLDLRRWSRELAQLPSDFWNEIGKPFVNEHITPAINDIKDNIIKKIGKTANNINFINNHSLKDVTKSYAAGVMENIRQNWINNWGNSIYFWNPNILSPTLKDINYQDFDTGPAQNTFLLPRSWQNEEMKKAGYIEGTPGDYGLVKKAVGNRNIPVYQRKPDAISRNKLKPIGNINSMWFGSDDSNLIHPGGFPSAIYTDNDGNLYQKAWDLNDYGGSGGSTSGTLGKLLDFIGNPIVQTTGFQPIEYDKLKRLPKSYGYVNIADYWKSVNDMNPIIEDGKFKGWSIPEIEVFGKKKRNGGNMRRTLYKCGRLKARNGTSKIPTWQDILNAAEMARVEKAQREQVLRNSRTESADYTTQSNDRTIVVNNNPNIQQEYNTHLPEFEGDPLVWDKAHPNLASWRNLVSASPYIIASAPLAAGVSGAAGTVGSAIARAAMSSRFAPVAKGIGTGLKWLNRGLTAGFAGHGIYDISQGNFTPMTALELAPIGIAGKALPAKLYDTETRAIEVAMRTGSSANPLEIMGSTISSMLRGQAGGTKRLFDIGKYILTGAKTGSKGYYNSFAYIPKDCYKGFTNRIMPRLTATTGNDFIDAALYGKTIDPAYGMTKVATGKDFGFHVDHVKQEYPDKLKNIQVYELNSRDAVPESSVVPIGRPHGAIEDSHLFRTINGTTIDAGGHMEQFGIPVSIDVSNMTKPKFIKAEDSWGFIPKRYAAKYKLDEAPIYLRPLINFGLDRVYKHVTPVISKSKWQKFSEYTIDL